MKAPGWLWTCVSVVSGCTCTPSGAPRSEREDRTLGPTGRIEASAPTEALSSAQVRCENLRLLADGWQISGAMFSSAVECRGVSFTDASGKRTIAIDIMEQAPGPASIEFMEEWKRSTYRDAERYPVAETEVAFRARNDRTNEKLRVFCIVRADMSLFLMYSAPADEDDRDVDTDAAALLPSVVLVP
jgi:hypothetical protein